MILIIDLQHIYYRCWYTRDKRPPLIATNGRNVSHVKATFEECIKIIKDYEFHYDADTAAVCICLDSNFDKLVKKERHPEYKANRQGRLDDTNKAEILYVAEALGRLGATVYGRPGYEADDLVYTIVKDNPSRDKAIYTSDADLLMHVNETTDVWLRRAPEYVRVKARRYASQVSFISKKRKEALYNDMVLYKSSVGDSSDNIKGILRFGDKAYDKVLSSIIAANPDLTVPPDYDGTVEFAKAYMGFTDEQMVQFIHALNMVYPYYCEGLEMPVQVSLKPFLAKSTK